MKKTTWTTYRISGYTHQVGDDPRATGGVHLHQIRRYRGVWQRRDVDSNGRFVSPGPVTTLDETEGAAAWAQAQDR